MAFQVHTNLNPQPEYLKWAKENNFISMLPKDAKRRHEEATADTQLTLNPHLRPKETIISYSEASFHTAAIQWLVETDQVSVLLLNITMFTSSLSKKPIHALQHPAFKNMIDIASRATHGVKIPTHKQTHQAIIDSFKKNLINLRNCLLVCAMSLLLPYN